MANVGVRFVFKGKDAPNTVSWPCTISVPKDGGVFEAQQITARFRVIPSDRARDLAAKSYADLLADVVDGFDGLADENGIAVDDATAKATLFATPYVVLGLVSGYFQMAAGREAKN